MVDKLLNLMFGPRFFHFRDVESYLVEVKYDPQLMPIFVYSTIQETWLARNKGFWFFKGVKDESHRVLWEVDCEDAAGDLAEWADGDVMRGDINDVPLEDWENFVVPIITRSIQKNRELNMGPERLL